MQILWPQRPAADNLLNQNRIVYIGCTYLYNIILYCVRKKKSELACSILHIIDIRVWHLTTLIIWVLLIICYRYNIVY